MKRFVSLFLACIMIFSLVVFPHAESGRYFEDVHESAWYYQDVKYVSENNLMQGTSEGVFSPNAPVSRAMLCTVLWRFAGEPIPTTSHFSDLEKGSWYYNAVNWMASKALIDGVGDWKFAPNNSITREQLAKILYNFSDYMKFNRTNRSSIYQQFTDGEKVSDYGIVGMEWCLSNGFIKGVTEKTLEPQATTTRAQLAAILHRFILWSETEKETCRHNYVMSYNPKTGAYEEYQYGDRQEFTYPTSKMFGYIRFGCTKCQENYCHLLKQGRSRELTWNDYSWIRTKLNKYIVNNGATLCEDSTNYVVEHYSDDYFFYTREEILEELKKDVDKILAMTDSDDEQRCCLKLYRENKVVIFRFFN